MKIKVILLCMVLVHVLPVSRVETLNNKKWNNFHSRR